MAPPTSWELREAAKKGDLARLQTLLSTATKDVINGGHGYGTALHDAARYGKTACVEALLLKGADIEAKNNTGRTALHWAAYKGETACLESLLAKGANIEAKDNKGKTALDLAKQGKEADAVRVLEAWLADKGAAFEAWLAKQGMTLEAWQAKYKGPLTAVMIKQPSPPSPPPEEGTPQTIFKLLLIGDRGVGKSCLVNRFSDDSFTTSFIKTFGVDFTSKMIDLDGKRIKLQIWDMGCLLPGAAYYRGAMGILLVYDVTDEQSFQNIRNIWIRNIDQHAADNVRKILLGNKADMVDDKVVESTRGEELAAEYGAKFYETSAKSNTNVTEAFTNIAKQIKGGADHAAADKAKADKAAAARAAADAKAKAKKDREERERCEREAAAEAKAKHEREERERKAAAEAKAAADEANAQAAQAQQAMVEDALRRPDTSGGGDAVTALLNDNGYDRGGTLHRDKDNVFLVTKRATKKTFVAKIFARQSDYEFTVQAMTKLPTLTADLENCFAMAPVFLIVMSKTDGDFETYLHEAHRGDWSVAASLLHEKCARVIELVRRVHEAGFVIHDLKASNIGIFKTPGLVSHDRLRIIDADSLRERGHAVWDDNAQPSITAQASSRAGGESRAWTVSPETDVWSLGMLLFRILTNANWFKAGMDDAAVLGQLVAWHRQPDLWDGIRRDCIKQRLYDTLNRSAMSQVDVLASFLDKALVVDGRQRCSVSDLAAHRFIRISGDANSLLQRLDVRAEQHGQQLGRIEAGVGDIRLDLDDIKHRLHGLSQLILQLPHNTIPHLVLMVPRAKDAFKEDPTWWRQWAQGLKSLAFVDFNVYFCCDAPFVPELWDQAPKCTGAPLHEPFVLSVPRRLLRVLAPVVMLGLRAAALCAGMGVSSVPPGWPGSTQLDSLVGAFDDLDAGMISDAHTSLSGRVDGLMEQGSVLSQHGAGQMKELFGKGYGALSELLPREPHKTQWRAVQAEHVFQCHEVRPAGDSSLYWLCSTHCRAALASGRFTAAQPQAVAGPTARPTVASPAAAPAPKPKECCIVS